MVSKKTLPLITDFDNIPEEALVPENEQPYKIPEHWKWVRLSSLNGYVAQSIDPRKTPASHFVLYSVPSYATGEPERVAGNAIGSTKQVVATGDVLICKINPRINRVWAVSNPPVGKLIASSEWIVFRPTIGFPNFYRLYFSSQYFRQKLTSQVSGVGGSLTRARPKIVNSYPVPLPPLDEQKRIVEYIEQTSTKIDDVIQRLEQYLDEAPNRRTKLIQAGVNGLLTSKWREKHGRSIDDWDSTTLGEAFRWSSGGTPSRKRPEYYEGIIPWIKSGELPDGRIADSEEHISDEAVANSSAKLFPPDSVLIAMYGATIGKVGILDSHATTNQAIACALPSPETIPDFLALFLRAKKPDFIALGKGGAQPNISQTVIKAFSFRRPPLDEQMLIVETILNGLHRIDGSVDLVQLALDDLRKLRDSTALSALSGRLSQ